MVDTLVYEKKDSLSVVALLSGGDLKEIEFSDSSKVIEGSVFLGKVTHKLDLANGKDGFLIDIGDSVDAFLNADEIGISDENITEGQSLIVQVLHEKREEKGAKLIRSLKFAGRYLVYCPYAMDVRVSSKIKEDSRIGECRQFVLDNVTGQEGWILRTSIVDADFDAIADEMHELRAIYDSIRKKARSSSAPALLYANKDALGKHISNYEKTLHKIVVNNHNVEESLIEEYGDSFDIVYSADPFEEYGLDESLCDALDKEVKLQNGGRITIEETKAFVAIDVDSGSGNASGSLARLNIDAAIEIVKQIRLRNLSGKIMIDFAGSSDFKYMKPVLDVLKQELDRDITGAYLAGLSRAGNVEIIRSRNRPSLQELLTEECDTCMGTGRVAR